MTKNEVEVLENLEKTYREAVSLICRISQKESDEMQKKICDQLNINCQTATKLTAILKDNNTTREKELTNIVTRYMQILGVPANIKGYCYLRTAIVLVINNNGLINSMMNDVYQTVAKRYNTTVSRVERAIRHAIEVSFSKTSDLKLRSEIFGNSIPIKKWKPTNSAYIAGVADYILQNHNIA